MNLLHNWGGVVRRKVGRRAPEEFIVEKGEKSGIVGVLTREYFCTHVDVGERT